MVGNATVINNIRRELVSMTGRMAQISEELDDVDRNQLITIASMIDNLHAELEMIEETLRM